MDVSLKRYAVVYVAAVIGVAVLGVALEMLLGLSNGGGISTVLPPFVAAMVEGQKVADAKAPPFTSSQAWRQARRMTGVVIGLNAVIFGLFLMVPDVRAMVVSAPGLVAVVLVLAIGAVFLVNRFALTWSYRNRTAQLSRASG